MGAIGSNDSIVMTVNVTEHAKELGFGRSFVTLEMVMAEMMTIP
jgi:hypothetical protein